jgi:hypothetical protein
MNSTKSNKWKKIGTHWCGAIGLKYGPLKKGEANFPITCDFFCFLWLTKAFN